MARGIKTGGRERGTPNKATAAVKEGLTLAFEGLGGVEGLQKWAKENPSEFYKLWARMLPSEVRAQITARTTLEDLICGVD